ncbi:unnamed protein product [Adineta ricciae]|uniref:Uncharacterized protein n=1 Tax=Adineta ricciae TaxID=249248 RepID=A0A814FXX5_ADIRI|nr:unnamed protein product [Adineta ricciae]CAF0989017.1 unnamed protein product [Adineta ricciae]
MFRKSSRRAGSIQLEEMPTLSQQPTAENTHDTSSISNSIADKNGNNELSEVNGEKQNSRLTILTNNTSPGIIPKAISTSEADVICTTVENVSHVRFEWTVEDFYPQMYECGDMIQSEEFPPYDLQKEFWTLRLYPKGHSELPKEYSNVTSSSSTYDSSMIQFYLTLCPSHITLNAAENVNQLYVYFRALINFSNSQGRVLHTETIHDCGGSLTNEIVLMKMTRSKCEQLYKECEDHLILSIELMSIDDITKRSLKTSSTKTIDGTPRVISKVMKMKLRWKIERFAVLITESSNNSYIESCEFTFNKQRSANQQTSFSEQDSENEMIKSTNDVPLHQWSLILYPNGKTERFKGSLSLFLEHTFGPSVRVVIRFSLVDERGRRVNTKQLPSHVLGVGERWGIGDFIKHVTLLQSPEQLTPNNELRLYCQVKILERQSIDEKKFITRLPIAFATNKSSLATSINDNPASYWPRIFYTAYQEKQMFDMYLRCANELFPVHKLILALRSTVFAKLIKEKELTLVDTVSSTPNRQNKRSNATETNSSATNGTNHLSLLTLDINDIDHQTLPYLLEYIYTGGIQKLVLPTATIPSSLIIDLLIIATNYDIPDLRNYAEYFVKDIIRVDNACELLSSYDKTKSDVLKQITCDFIANNLGHIMETPGWSELKVKQPDLIDLLLKSCLLLRK